MEITFFYIQIKNIVVFFFCHCALFVHRYLPFSAHKGINMPSAKLDVSCSVCSRGTWKKLNVAENSRGIYIFEMDASFKARREKVNQV